ncbi:MAG: serine/threonine-protein kinase [Terriglobales bacterium]
MPEKIGRYEITGELGKGAMGVVYKAIDPNIGREVALKTMRVDVHGAEAEDMLKRFQNEARAAGALSHPNIVTIYDAGETEGGFYIAMEFIPGKTLAQLLREVRTVSAEQIVNIGAQICAGLDYAHIKGVIHRDIKPPNIMIAPDGTVKIMDFGIAKAGASLTHTGEVLGTPNYMSPEQVKGKDLDGRTDLFSTGVILYEMATGERPFNGQNVTTIIYKIIHETPPAPRELDVTIHPGLSQVIAKCLAKDPEDRYQVGSDLAMALKSYKIISVAEPRATANPMANTGFATRPMQATPGSMLRTAAPGAAAAAATARSTGNPALQEQVPTEIIKPRVVPAPKQGPKFALVVAAVLLVVAIAAGIGILKTHRAQPAPTSAATVPVNPAPAATANPRSAVSTPPDSVIHAGSTAAHAHVPKPAPVEGVGELRVTSNPPGASIEIDGVSQDWYVTPFNTPPLKSGTHSVRAQLAGLIPQTRQVEVVANQKVILDFQLAGDKAIYNITSSPSGAEILIDGIVSGHATPAQLTLTPGQHRVVLRLEGFSPSETTTDAAAGQSITLAPVLRARNSIISQPVAQEGQGLGNAVKLRRFYAEGEIPEGMGALQVRTRPKGVTITVDSVAVPKATPFRFPLRPGKHVVLLQKDGFQPVARTIQIEEGRQLEIDEILPPQR